MRDFFYDPVGIAYCIDEWDMRARSQTELLKRIYMEDNAFLNPIYRSDKRRFIYDVMYWAHYLADRASLDAEFPLIEQDFRCRGLEIDQNRCILPTHFAEQLSVDWYFMRMRFQIRFLGTDCVMTNLWTVLRSCGYRRSSVTLMNHIRDCIMSYHIQPFLRGKRKCDIRKVRLNDTIVFRVI